MKRLLLLALLLVAGFALFCFASGDRDEKRIRAVFHTVETNLEKQGDESLLLAHRKAAALAALIAPDCLVIAPEAGVRRILPDDESCMRDIMLARQMVDSVSVSFDDLDISVSDGSSALVKGDVSLLGQSSAWGFQTIEAREMVAQLQKGDDGKWRFRQVAVRPLISK